jgi:phospholipid-binding lipoprotein MlaA
LWAVAIAVVALGGCGGLPNAVRIDPSVLTAPEPPGPSPAASDSSGASSASGTSIEPIDASAPPPVLTPAVGEGGDGEPEVTVAQAQSAPQDKETGGPPSDDEDYDPWERFNEKVFEFNRQTDRFVLKPVRCTT